jgi:hypothetical protein
VIKSNIRLATILTFLFLCPAVFAQQAAPASSEEILNDKSGKYVAIESDSQFLLEKGWFAQMHCVTPANGLISAKIGLSLFRFPEGSLRGVLTGSLILAEGIKGKYRKYFRANTGCPENPIEVALAELVPPGSGIFPDIAIKETPQHQGLTKTAAGLLDLRDRATEKPDTCLSALKGTIIACSGGSSAGPVSYILANDRNLVLESGAPLNVKCNHQPSLVCGVNDDVSGGVSYSAVVKGQMTDFTIPFIQDAHKAARALVDGYRVKN